MIRSICHDQPLVRPATATRAQHRGDPHINLWSRPSPARRSVRCAPPPTGTAAGLMTPSRRHRPTTRDDRAWRSRLAQLTCRLGVGSVPWLIAIRGGGLGFDVEHPHPRADASGLTCLGQHRVHHADLAARSTPTSHSPAAHDPNIDRPGRVPSANDAAGPTEAARLTHNASSSNASVSSHGSGDVPHTRIDVRKSSVLAPGHGRPPVVPGGGRGVHDLTLPGTHIRVQGSNMQGQWLL